MPGLKGLSLTAACRLVGHGIETRTIRRVGITQRRATSSTNALLVDPAAILSKPTWSVRSLLGPELQDNGAKSDEKDEEFLSPEAETYITVHQLHHLLRLSALPPPASTAEEFRMLSVLQSQLRFVRDIQAVDVSGVSPLRAIRDETSVGRAEVTIGVDRLRNALAEEAPFGRARRPRRRHLRQGQQTAATEVDGQAKADAEKGWDPLQTTSHKVGRYFVVRSAKEDR
ncbi:hypothetical protein VTK73DRAFT_3306 [Phialemonium thermophilum]|uniref:Glutamyl-tRNA amidotransferase complex subunit Gta3 domain-containing protein n=1 Tax=Phialemonium thermophilum TaxID=223376 RepID=A0ABR3Y214_9PEZI